MVPENWPFAPLRSHVRGCLALGAKISVPFEINCATSKCPFQGSLELPVGKKRTKFCGTLRVLRGYSYEKPVYKNY